MNFFDRSRPLNAVSLAPLIVVCVGVILAAIPLFEQAAGWAALVLILASGVRIFLNRKAARLPSLPLKIGLFGLGVAATAFTYGGMLGIEPGLSILFVLVSLKIVETNGERDFQVLVLLGCFLGMCSLFFSQDLLLWLYVGAVFLVLMTTLVRFQTGDGGTFLRSARVSVTLLLQALPIIALLFLVFPRSYGGFRFQFSRSLLRSSGMSERLAPGSIASLALNADLAFRADFPDGNTPPLSQLYWRGGVFWRGDGLTWVPGPQLSIERRLGQLAGETIRQRISLQPHGGRWLFALDRPTGNQPKFEFMPGGYIQSTKMLFSTFHYEVISQPENRELTLLPDQRNAALALPPQIGPRVRSLVESWKRPGQTERELVERALHYFRAERFSYTLEPGTYGENALEEFLFERRAGFCEHYAACFATLMRVAGLPSRVVVGYHGGEFNRLGNYVIVKQSDAHAWAEVWLNGFGWLRVDPTEVIAPDRISSGFSSYLESRADSADLAAQSSSTAALGWREIMREVRLVWDSINYQWDLRILNFNEDEQRTFLAQFGFDHESWPAILGWTAGLILGVLAVIALWLRRGGRVALDEAGRAWQNFGAALARAGVRREPSEGPLRFGQRAAAELADHRTEILEVATLYMEIRYSPTPPSSKKLTEAVRRLPRLRPPGRVPVK